MRGWVTARAGGLLLWIAGTAALAQSPSQGQGRFVVVLDAAHGGDDAGAQLAGSTAEKTVTLNLSVRLRSLLTARGFQVVTTRESNNTVSSVARAQVANHATAAACLSLHATETGSGVHLFVSSLEPQAGSRFLAWKTAQAAYVARSLKLASVVNSALQHSSGSDGDSDAVSIPVTLTRTALPGVDSMACPALAIEVAPLRADKGSAAVTNEATDARYQAQVIEALAAAMLEWRTDWQSESGAAGGGRQP